MVKIISHEPLQLVVKFSEIDDRLDVGFYNPKYSKVSEKIDEKVNKENQPRLGDETFSKLNRITGFARTEHVIYIKEKQIPFLRVQDIEELGIILDFVKYISFEAHKNLPDSQVKEGDLIMTTTGAVGLTTVVPEGLECNATQEVIRIRLTDKWNGQDINPYYVALYCNSHYFRLFLERWGSGSSRPRTLIKNIRKIRIPLIPSKDANKLGNKYKGAIDKRMKAMNTFNKIKKIFKENIGIDFSSSKRPIYYITKKSSLKNEIIKNKLIENRIDSKYYNPFYYSVEKQIDEVGSKKDFQIVKLSTLADYSDRPLPKFQNHKKYKYIRILNINKTLGFIKNYQEYSKSDMPNRASLTLEENNIITANSGNKTGTTKHRTAIVPKELAGSIGSSAFATLRPKNEKYSSLIYATLRTELGLVQIRRLLRGSSTPYLSTYADKIDDLGGIRIIIPPTKILQQIDSLVKSYNSEIYEAYDDFAEAKNELLRYFNHS